MYFLEWRVAKISIIGNQEIGCWIFQQFHNTKYIYIYAGWEQWKGEMLQSDYHTKIQWQWRVCIWLSCSYRLLRLCQGVGVPVGQTINSNLSTGCLNGVYESADNSGLNEPWKWSIYSLTYSTNYSLRAHVYSTLQKSLSINSNMFILSRNL